MKKQIIRVSPVQNAKVMAVLYFVLSIPFVLLMLLMPTSPGTPSWFFMIMPVLYLVLGFIFSLVAAWVYNLVASQVGGLEFTTAEVGDGGKVA